MWPSYEKTNIKKHTKHTLIVIIHALTFTHTYTHHHSHVLINNDTHT